MISCEQFFVVVLILDKFYFTLEKKIRINFEFIITFVLKQL